MTTSPVPHATICDDHVGTTDDLAVATGGQAARADVPALLADPDVQAALDAHERANVALVEAKQRVAAARDDVRDRLFAAGAPHRDRTSPLPTDDLSRLYWDHAELRPTDLASALGISTTELQRLAGPAERHVRCRICHESVSVAVTSRSQQLPDVRCQPCLQREAEIAERDRQRDHELELARVAAGLPPGPLGYGAYRDDRHW